MSDTLTLEATYAPQEHKAHLYRRMILLAGSSLVVCGALVFYFGRLDPESPLAQVGSRMDLAVMALLPYMISAVIAASTAVAIITILPNVRSVDPTERILDRLRVLSNGDLTSRVVLSGEGQLKEIASELNNAIGTLGRQVTSLKIVNRQQWSSLCCIREAAEMNDAASILAHVEEMEKNWVKIAEIERQLTT